MSADGDAAGGMAFRPAAKYSWRRSTGVKSWLRRISLDDSEGLTGLIGTKMFPIAVLVPTHDRPELLAERSLASIARQTRTPDYLIIIDDSGLASRPANERIAAGTTNVRGPAWSTWKIVELRGLSGARQHRPHVAASGSPVGTGRDAG